MVLVLNQVSQKYGVHQTFLNSLHTLHTNCSQLLNIIILKFNSPVLLIQLDNILQYLSSSTGSVLENILPVELWLYLADPAKPGAALQTPLSLTD